MNDEKPRWLVIIAWTATGLTSLSGGATGSYAIINPLLQTQGMPPPPWPYSRPPPPVPSPPAPIGAQGSEWANPRLIDSSFTLNSATAINLLDFGQEENMPAFNRSCGQYEGLRPIYVLKNSLSFPVLISFCAKPLVYALVTTYNYNPCLRESTCCLRDNPPVSWSNVEESMLRPSNSAPCTFLENTVHMNEYIIFIRDNSRPLITSDYFRIYTQPELQAPYPPPMPPPPPFMLNSIFTLGPCCDFQGYSTSQIINSEFECGRLCYESNNIERCDAFNYTDQCIRFYSTNVIPTSSCGLTCYVKQSEDHTNSPASPSPSPPPPPPSPLPSPPPPPPSPHHLL